MRYYAYFSDTETFEPLDEGKRLSLLEKMKKTKFTWEGRVVLKAMVKIYTEKQYRMLKGWDLNNEEDRKEVAEYFKEMKELTRNFNGDLSEYGEVIDEKVKLVQNEILAGEIGLILLAEKMNAIKKKNGNWLIVSKDKKTPEWNYFFELKRALRSYQDNYTYQDEQYLKERNQEIEAIKNRIKKKFELSTNKNV